MKILHAVENYYPSISGSPEVVRHISERLVKMGHEVTVVARKLPERKSLVHNGVKIVEFNVWSATSSGMSIVNGLAGETKEYQDFLRQGDFDIFMTYAAQQWTTDLSFDVLDEIKAKKVLVPCGYSALYMEEYRDYFKQLPKYLRKFDATVYMAEDYRDINFAKQHHLKNTRLIPNGADETEFTKPLGKDRKVQLKKKYGLRGLIIMTVANYTGEKGHAELIHVFKRLPITPITLVSAGGATPGIGSYDMFKGQAERINSSPKFPGKKVVMVDGSNRRDVVDLLKLADIFVFLSNIEASPLVLYEAAAAGTPFVATNAGNSAEIARWTKGGVIAKSYDKPNGRVAADPRDVLIQVTKLAYSPIRRKRMGRRAHKNWLQKYTWRKLAQDYENLYKSLLGK